ncbi:MAG: amino acid adenylation domain-containing protein [Gammaproteobacteria bacterium]|nr:amino acid adenylation domain-containing protein [Gammaproteobacteria bacterium]MCP4832826.1 amino acid adenylation domain-containing protein [Gammaproteobacteria bacterium]
MSPAELIAKISDLGGRLYLDNDELRLQAPKGSLSDELRAELKIQKQDIIAFLLAAQASVAKQGSAITSADRDQPLPASFSQQRLWFLDELEPGSSTYSMPWSMRLKGELNIAALQAAIDDLVARHESLRTRFASEGAMPLQVIDSSFKILVEQETQHDATDSWLADWLVKKSSLPFNLSKGPLLRVYLLETAVNDYRLLINIHHIVSDGWSMSILFQELSLLYAAHCTGKSAQLQKLPVQYADFAVWQRAWLEGAELDRQISYWRDTLADAPPLLELPTDRPRPAIQTYVGDHVKFKVPKELTGRLQAIAQAQGASMFMLMQAAFDVLLARYAGTEDVVIGTPIAGRQHTELESVIGFFLNTLVLRTNITGNPTFIELLERVRKVTLSAYDHQDLPFEKLVEELRPEREPSHSPLFQVLFNLRTQNGGALEWHGLDVDFDHVERATAKVDLALSVDVGEQGLALEFEYNTDLFDRLTIEEMARGLVTMLEGIAADSLQRIGALPLSDEQDLLRHQAAETAAKPGNIFIEFPASEIEQSIVKRFEAQVCAHGDRLVAHSAEVSWTYAQLNSKANKVAQDLRTLVGDGEQRVGLLVGQDVPMLAGLFGVLKAGMAYVPLDPEAPTARHEQISSEAKLSAIVTDAQHRSLADELVHEGLGIVELDPNASADIANPDLSIAPDTLAYILFTSGSTGTPKGVMQTHRNVLHHCRTYTNAVHIGMTDRLSLLPPYGFDAAVMDIFGALLNGASLHPYDLRNSVDPELITRSIVDDEVSVFHSTPTVFRYLFEQGQKPDLSRVRLVVLGGEEVRSTDFELFQTLFSQDAVFVNGLGPSESTLALQYFAHHDTTLPGMVVPVGRAVNNTEIVLLDKHGNPSGICGELAIRSAYVTPGYWNSPDLTEAVLSVQDESGRRLYRTGDHARYLANGQLIFTGREDAQIKLRGHRIETGEIEAVLTEHPVVDNCIVILHEAKPAAPQLVAYLASVGGSYPDAAEIRDYVRDKLPAYMVPAGVIWLDELPMTANGKVDRNALPVPEWQAEAEYVEPRTTTEEVLVEIWSDVLGVEKIGINDDFFALGGHSLLATQLVARVRERLHVELALRAVFETPTVAGFAGTLDAGGTDIAVPDITLCDRGIDVPQSFAQQRLWFLDQLEPGSSVYHLSQAVQLKGSLDLAALQLALDDFVVRHEILRTTFAEADSGPIQVIAKELQIPVQVMELPDTDKALLSEKLTELSAEPFDLGAGPLFRLHVLKQDAGSYVLVMNIHHIISDMWSLNILWQDLTRLYNAHCRKVKPDLTPLELQYADYAVWQHDWLSGKELERQVTYWKEQLSGIPPLLQLPTDRPRPSVQTYNGDFVSWEIGGDTPVALKRLANESGSTMFMVLLAAFNVLLGRYTGACDIAVGSPIAGRRHAKLENLIGFFVNTLVMRTDLSGDPTFNELLERVKCNTLDAYEHQDLPFEKLVDVLQPVRDMSHTPLFQVAFILQNAPGKPAAFDGMEGAGLGVAHGHSKFDLLLSCSETVNGLGGLFEFNTDLFDRGTIERFANSFKLLLDGMSLQPDIPVSKLPLLDDREYQCLVTDWNNTAADYPADSTIHAVFEAQAERHPDSIALGCGDEQLSYAELNARANQLAYYLIAHGVVPESPVAICMDRGINAVVAILATLKAGGAYMPLDPAYPADRLQFMLEDSGAPILLSMSSIKLDLDINHASCERIDIDVAELGEVPDSNLVSKIHGRSLAYIIYTSGSTGQPKGTLIEHRSVLRLVLNTNYNDFSTQPSIAMLAPISFDASTYELWGSLLNGGQCIIFPERIPDIDSLGSFLATHQVDSMWLTSTFFNTVIDMAPEILRHVPQILTGGEALSLAHIDKATLHLPDTQLINGYGPTESTTFTCTFGIPKKLPADWPSVPIGRPIANTTVFILDGQLQPVPVGVVGELHIGGDGLSRGYLNQPDLTNERFIADPFSNEVGARLYKTGDLVRHLPDGNIEFVGRKDSQIKLRGFRIELGEIEACLREHVTVSNTAVVLHESVDGDKRLIGYVVAEETAKLAVQELEKFVGEHLPKYMIPSLFVEVEKIPLTVNGKVDEKALPAPEWQPQEGYESPRNTIEEALCNLWADTLGLKQVGIHDDFFALGGHSLLIMKLIRQIELATGKQITIADIFENPTISEFGALLEGTAWKQIVFNKPGILSRIRRFLVR